MIKLLTPIIFIGLSLGIFFWYIYPQYQQIQILRDTSSQYQSALDRAHNDVQKRDALLAKYRSFNPADLDRLKKFLPDNVGPINFAVDVTNLVSRYGIAVKDIKIDDSLKTSNPPTVSPSTGTAKPYESLGLSFSVAMPYDQFIQFLADIEKSLRYMDISSIKFDANGTTGLYTYTIGLKTYTLNLN